MRDLISNVKFVSRVRVI